GGKNDDLVNTGPEVGQGQQQAALSDIQRFAIVWNIDRCRFIIENFSDELVDAIKSSAIALALRNRILKPGEALNQPPAIETVGLVGVAAYFSKGIDCFDCRQFRRQV